MSKQTQKKQKSPKKKPAPKGPIAPGEAVKWMHGRAGGSVNRRGAVLAHVPKGHSIRSTLVRLGRHEDAARWGIGTQRSAVYVVEVDGNLYTPYAGVIERANPRAKRTPAS